MNIAQSRHGRSHRRLETPPLRPVHDTDAAVDRILAAVARSMAVATSFRGPRHTAELMFDPATGQTAHRAHYQPRAVDPRRRAEAFRLAARRRRAAECRADHPRYPRHRAPKEMTAQSLLGTEHYVISNNITEQLTETLTARVLTLFGHAIDRVVLQPRRAWRWETWPRRSAWSWPKR